MKKAVKQKSYLTKYQTRLLREYENILKVTGLNPDRVFDFIEDDPEAIVPVIKSMIDQVIRSDVIFEYTFIDMELGDIIIHHFFGSGKKLKNAKKTKRFKTLNLILQNMYLMQKLTLVKSFKDIPRPIFSKIGAINELSNGLSHTFLVYQLKPSKRTYKKHNIFTRKGLKLFHEDVLEIRNFFMPWLKRLQEDNEIKA